MTRTRPSTFLLLLLLMPGFAMAAGAPSETQPAPTATLPTLLPNPALVMQQMARELDKHPNQGVFVLETITITQGEVADYIRAMPVSMASLGYNAVFRHAVEALVGQKAMVINAMHLDLDKDPAVIRRTAALHDRALADAWLTRQGEAAISDEKLHALYDSKIAGKPGPTEVRTRMIVVPTEDEARSIIEKAQNGADFGELAKTFSKDGSSLRDGDLGYATMEALTPEIGAVAFATQVGQVTAFPVPTQGGYFILRIEGRRKRATPTFDEARPQLEAQLRSEGLRDAVQNVLTHIKLAPVAKPGGDTPK